MIIQTNKPLQPRVEHDFYPTPIEFAIAGVNLLPDTFSPSRVLDPGAGTGVWGEAIRVRYSIEVSTLTGVELRWIDKFNYVYDEWITSDYLDEDTLRYNHPYDLVIGNPPYKFAEQFVRKSMAMLNPGGYCLFLLRLAFLESKRRLDLWGDYPPQQVVVCANRPSFTGNGRTDATAYAYFLWQRGYTGKTGLSWVMA